MKHAIRAALLSGIIAAPIGAQSVAVADSLLQRGNVDRAESVYYAAVRVKPRDPAARLGLGRYLAGRGAIRVAVPLLEEANKFGGNATEINADLAPLYLAVADYRALAALTPSPLTAGERERARWLEAHPTRVIAPDSVTMAIFHPKAGAGYVGTMPIRINGLTVEASIAPRSSGIMISDSLAHALKVRRFPAGAQGGEPPIPAVADSVGIGRVVFTNFPVSVGKSIVATTIGLDVLSRLAPTFESQIGRLTLRTNGSVPAHLIGDRFATWATTSDYQMLRAGGWISLADRQVTRMLDDRSWTLDAKRGVIVLGR